jgi:transcriptional regulator with XRE-family HTH domain
MPERVAVGRNIRSLRDWRKLGQESLAEATGVHAVQISRVENGAADTGIDTYILLARGLRVPLHWLFTSDWPQFIADGEDAVPHHPDV